MSSERSEFRISANLGDLRRIRQKYGTNLSNRIARVTEKYSGADGLIKRDAKKIIEDAGQRDTGRLINSIKPSLRIYADKVVGEIKAGTNYARFIHEGADHKGTSEVHPHFVKFSTAPGLLAWAKRHKKIERIRGDWHFIDKNNQEHRISDINKSGIVVIQKPLKYFETPFNKYADKYVKDLEALLK